MTKNYVIWTSLGQILAKFHDLEAYYSAKKTQVDPLWKFKGFAKIN